MPDDAKPYRTENIMRNENVTLTPAQAANVATRVRQLRGTEGQTRTLAYVKRDGTDSTATGAVIEVDTRPGGHGFVKMETERGFRTVNLHLIKSVSVVPEHTHTHGPDSYTYTGANGCGYYVAVCGVCGSKADPQQGF